MVDLDSGTPTPLADLDLVECANVVDEAPTQLIPAPQRMIPVTRRIPISLSAKHPRETRVVELIARDHVPARIGVDENPASSVPEFYDPMIDPSVIAVVGSETTARAATG